MNYTEQDSQLTLAEGLDEYYACNPSFQNFDGLLGMPADVILAHDVAHVIFGCGSSSADELVVETWTALGCTISAKKYGEVIGDGFIGGVRRRFGVYRLFRRLLLTSPRVARTAVAALRTRRKWPHFAYQPYLDVPLRSLRQQFGIRVV